jgi:hypothetical protein
LNVVEIEWDLHMSMASMLLCKFVVHYIYFTGRFKFVGMRLNVPVGLKVIVIIIIVPEMNAKSDE